MAGRRLDAEELFLRWRTSVRAQARAQAAARAAVAAAVIAAWRQMRDPYSPAEGRVFAAAAAAAVAGGRTRAADLTLADLRQVLDVAGVDLGRSRVSVAAQPRGIPLAEEMLRAPAQVRWEVSQGRGLDQAMQAGLTRAQVMADYDVALAARDAFADATSDVPQVIGWRRMLHPELSTSGSCGLCIAAGTRTYHKQDLLPLHGRCHCIPFIVLEGQDDIAQRINDLDLEQHYRAIGLTKRAELAKVRVRVEQHGELGPTLVENGHHFRGPDDIPS